MIISTTDVHTDYEVLGLVRGSSMRARHLGMDAVATLRKIVGGELKEYSEMLKQTREEAIQLMIRAAEAQGANAVIGVRLATSTVTTGVAEVIAYGTAVKIQA